MKKGSLIFCLLALVLLLIVLVYNKNKRNQENKENQDIKIKICTIQYVDHPNLDNVYHGFQKEIDKWAKEKGKKVTYELQNANGDVNIADQIAKTYAIKKPNIILALGTPAAQAAQNSTSTIPIVFGAITDPVEAGLAESMEKPGRNLTGSCDKWPYEKQFEMIKLLMPNISSIGVVFNPSESNTENSMREIRRIVKQMGLLLNEASVSKSTEVYSAAQSLIRKSDILYAPADNTVLSAIEAYLKVAKQYKKPLFVGDQGSVKKGGIATFGPDYYELGVETGKLGVRILNGEKPSEIGVAVASSGALVINKSSSEFFNITYPDSLLKTAKFFE